MLFAGLLLAAVAAPVTHYELKVAIEPDARRLTGEVRIARPPAQLFYLYKGFSVTSVRAAGKPVPFRIDASAKPLPYSPAAVAVSYDSPPSADLEVRYEGTMAEVVSGVNTISQDLVELAIYSAWFPQFDGLRESTYSLEADIPSSFGAITNGRQSESRLHDGRVRLSSESFRPGFDIVLLASPKLRKLVGGPAGTRVEMVYSQLPEATLQSKMDALAGGMRRLSSLYGEPRVKGVLRFAYSPRAGWGYARIPLFVVSEERALGALRGEMGEAKDFRDNAHEMAHFWWMIADTATSDDWLNEGLAEYSAFRLASERHGPAFSAVRLAEYEASCKRAKTGIAVAETPGDSPDREVNRYNRAPLVLIEAERRFGTEALDRLLKHLHLTYAGSARCTTLLFLEAARRILGPDAESYFRDELYRRATVGAPAGR